MLTNWKKLPEGSSALQGILTETMKKGGVSKAYFKNPITGKNLEFEQEITDYEEGLKFGWSGKVVSDMNDHHIYSVEGTERGMTIFRQEDFMHSVQGSHSRKMNFITKHGLAAAYKSFNKGLKARIESLYPRK